jgi:AraC-like DNA-binding protein
MPNRLLAPRRWSLSEFLNLIDVRSQCWCFVEMRSSGNFRIPRSDGIMFYAVLNGKAKITRGRTGVLLLRPGDIAMVVSGEAHAVRCERAPAVNVFDFLHQFEYVDAPPDITLGEGRPLARLLCGNLKVRWPGGHVPQGMPAFLTLKATNSPVDLNSEALARISHGGGASSVLTRMAALLFTAALRGHPDLDRIFRDAMVVDPVQRALDFIHAHPFQDWTVEGLARKVGMGRSNFAARFTEEVGKPPMAVLMEERMNHAAMLLENTDLKVSEISEQIGYRSEAAFSRRFASRFGIAPGRMRDHFRQAAKWETDASVDGTPAGQLEVH